MAFRWARARSILAAAALLTFAGSVSFVPDVQARSAIEASQWPQSAGSLKPEKTVVWGQLPNGLRYAVMPNKTPSKSVALRMRIGAGSLDETDAQKGLAHFLEHMAFNGSAKVPEGDMVKILERYGLAFGPDTNAFTSFEETVYQLDLPTNGDPIVDQGLMLMNETARNLTLAPDSIDRERGVIKSEERLRNTPAYRAYIAGAKFALPNARLTQRVPIGDLKVISNAPRDQFVEFYKRGYRPDRTVIVVVGDVDPAKIADKIKAQFGDWTIGGKVDGTPAPGPSGPPGLDAGYFFEPEAKTTITFSYVRPYKDEPDSAAQRRKDMTRDLADAILSRRFRALSRQADAKILGAAAYYDDAYKAADMSILNVSAEPKNWKAALQVGEQELRRALTHGFSKAEMDEQLSEMRATFKNAAQYAPTRKSADLADALVSAVNEEIVFTHPQDDLALFEEFARTVSVKSLNAAFRANWQGAEPKIFLATSVQVPDAKNAILAAYKESRAIAVAKPAKVQSDAFAYTDFGPAGAVAERKDVTDLSSTLKLTEVRFANNVRLNIIKTPFERDTVRAAVRVCCGAMDLAGSPAGFPTYLESVFALGGLEKHSADDLERLNAGRTAEFGMSVDEDSYSFTGVVTPADLEWQLEVWAAELSAPGYRPEAQAIFQKNVAVWLETLDATPQSVLGRDLGSILRNRDPRWTIPDRSTFEAMKLEDAKQALARPFSSGAIEISLVGDVDPDKAIAYVARTLGALPARDAVRKPAAGNDTVTQPAMKDGVQMLFHKGPKNRAAAVINWDGGDFFENPARGRQLRILAAIVDLKLTEDLRERLGDTYAPSVNVEQSETFKGIGVLSATIDLEPEKLKIFYAEIQKITAEMAAGKIDDDEFTRATKPIIEGLPKSEEDNQYWLRVADSAQFRPESLGWHRSRRSDYQTATLPQIKALAKQIFGQARGLRVEVRPEGT